MYKAIFLDDESITLRMLENAIDWQKYDVVCCGSANDGEEGLELFRQVGPDIVIADIRMPKMNGIEFARVIRETKKRVKILLLSAYAEFEYAQSALTYEISDYLLKPLDEDKLEAAIARIVQELDHDTAISGTIESYRFEQAEKQLQQLLLQHRENPSPGGITLTDGAMKLFEQANTLLYVLRVAESRDLQIDANPEGIRMFVKDRFGPLVAVVSLSPVELVVLTSNDGLQERLQDMLEVLRAREQPVRVGISRTAQPLDLIEAYRQAEHALDTCFYSGANAEFYSTEQSFTSEISPKLADFEKPIAKLVEQGKSAELIDRLCADLTDLFGRRVKPSLIHTLVFDILNWVKISISKQYSLDSLIDFAVVDHERIRACANQEALITFLASYLQTVDEGVNALQAKDPGYFVVRQAKDYTRSHYAEAAFSLQMVADCVGLSKNHFSRVFHSTTGTKFWDYVTQLRIDKAKELLRESNRTNYEICQEIGYESEFYFSRVFKKVVGVTAQEFRRL